MIFSIAKNQYLDFFVARKLIRLRLNIGRLKLDLGEGMWCYTVHFVICNTSVMSFKAA